MPRRANLDEWGMCWEEYKELCFFCLQYEHKKAEASALLTIKLSTPIPEVYYTERVVKLSNGKEKTVKVPHGIFMPHGSGHVSDPVAATAAKRDRLLKDVRMIEQAAQLATEDTGIKAQYIIRAVTNRGGVQALYANPDTRPPMGVRQFNQLRRKYFWVLREMRNGDIEPLPS